MYSWLQHTCNVFSAICLHQSSGVCFQWLTPETASVPQPQKFLANSTIKKRLTPDRIPLRQSRKRALYELNLKGNELMSEIRSSKLLYDWRSVSQYALVSSTLWDLRTDITSCRYMSVWNLRSCSCGAPSLMRIRVCNFHCSHSMVRVAQDP
jgi:hypothetical protein